MNEYIEERIKKLESKVDNLMEEQYLTDKLLKKITSILLKFEKVIMELRK